MAASRTTCTCQFCGHQFQILTSKIKHGCGKFCSPGCQRESSKRQVELSCATCGNAYLLPQSHSNGSRFCSKVCARKGMKNTPIATRFWRFVLADDKRQANKCWNWQGSLSHAGYGQIMGEKNDRRPRLAHVISWEIHNHKKARLYILHSCDNPRCVNPNHLRQGTQGENVYDMMARDRVCRGERRKIARLTDAAVLAARDAYSKGELIRNIAKKYGVSRQAMCDAVMRRTWKHVS